MIVNANLIKKSINSAGKEGLNTKKNSTIPIIFLYIYYKLYALTKKLHCFPYLPTGEVLRIMRIIVHCPKTMNYLIIHELEAYGLIKKINHQKFYINDTKAYEKHIRKIKDIIGYEFW